MIVGLTGGIATGKSTVSAIFKDAGAVIIDADRIAHDAVKKGTAAWQEIVDHFGQSILQPDGELDRDRLGDIVFNDQQKKQQLNSIVHPAVFKNMAEQVEQATEDTPVDGVIILDVPLLIEAGMQNMVSDVILVYTSKEIQLKRLMKRNSLSETDAMARIRSQMPIEEKKKEADIIIDNSFSIDKTKERTLEVYRNLKKKSANQLL